MTGVNMSSNSLFLPPSAVWRASKSAAGVLVKDPTVTVATGSEFFSVKSLTTPYNRIIVLIVPTNWYYLPENFSVTLVPYWPLLVLEFYNL